MAFEFGVTPKTEQEPTLKEEINGLEGQVHKLVEEIGINLDATKVEELGATAEGQSQLLKMYDASKRFNERVQVVVGGLAASSTLTSMASRIVSDPGLQASLTQDAQFWYAATASAVMFWLVASLVKATDFDKRARSVLDKIKSE